MRFQDVGVANGRPQLPALLQLYSIFIPICQLKISVYVFFWQLNIFPTVLSEFFQKIKYISQVDILYVL